MRRIRSLILVVAMACAVLAGSSSAASAAGSAISPLTARPGLIEAGKRW